YLSDYRFHIFFLSEIIKISLFPADLILIIEVLLVRRDGKLYLAAAEL
ncbi:unnamed protein product, partial [Brassica oleracea]